jgi:hypothetical protein
MEMRRLEPMSELLDRLSELEESIRSGKPPAKTLGSSVQSRNLGSNPTSVPTNPVAGSSGAHSSHAAAAATKPALAPEYEVTSAVTSPRSEATDYTGDSDIDRIKGALERRRKMFLVTALETATVAAIEGDELYVEFATDARHLRDTLAKAENVKVIREACLDVRGRETGVRIIVKTQNDEGPLSKEDIEQQEKRRLREEAEQNPVVKQMLRTFRGEITDVRRIPND